MPTSGDHRTGEGVAAHPEGSLPEPDSNQRAHAEALMNRLLNRLEQGPMPFSEYMNRALYEPGLGYYMAGAHKFGEGGDFITAPEVSPLFGAALANQCLALVDELGSHVLELGAGSGRLAASLCRSMADTPDFSYTILEPSGELQDRQSSYLRSELPGAVFERVSWVHELPSGFKGVAIANEVMDALPVERFRAGKPLRQIEIDAASEGADHPLVERVDQASNALSTAVAAIEQDLGRKLADGYSSEVCLLLEPWLASLADAVETGVILLLDYGYPRREYYLEERDRGTLRCYFRHRAHDDPYFWPGLQDITAHVDFTRVAEAAQNHDLELLGYASQASFLLDNDLLGLAEARLSSLSTDVERIQNARAVKQLTLPGEMGERFQVMALGKGYDRALRGFTSQDLTHRL